MHSYEVDLLHPFNATSSTTYVPTTNQPTAYTPGLCPGVNYDSPGLLCVKLVAAAFQTEYSER